MDWMGGRTDGLADYILSSQLDFPEARNRKDTDGLPDYIHRKGQDGFCSSWKKLSLKCFNLKMLGSKAFILLEIGSCGTQTYYGSNSLKLSVLDENGEYKQKSIG